MMHNTMAMRKVPSIKWWIHLFGKQLVGFWSWDLLQWINSVSDSSPVRTRGPIDETTVQTCNKKHDNQSMHCWDTSYATLTTYIICELLQSHFLFAVVTENGLDVARLFLFCRFGVKIDAANDLHTLVLHTHTIMFMTYHQSNPYSQSGLCSLSFANMVGNRCGDPNKYPQQRVTQVFAA